jgi:hypothetical protein
LQIENGKAGFAKQELGFFKDQKFQTSSVEDAKIVAINNGRIIRDFIFLFLFGT